MSNFEAKVTEVTIRMDGLHITNIYDDIKEFLHD